MIRLVFTLLMVSALAGAQSTHRVRTLRIQVLSTMLADDDGIGEWGFAALVEADGHRFLFDTGAHPTTVLNNARDLGVDLSGVQDVILSHNHGDHTGGLVTLRRELRSANAGALSRVHAGKGIFLDRRRTGGGTADFVIGVRRDYEALDGHVTEYDHPVELAPGLWLTGPVPRKYPERNWSPGVEVRLADRWVEDNIPEDMSLVADTDQGLVVLSGCGHAGIANTLEYARAAVRAAPVHAVVGGFHLYQLDDEKLAWTAGKLREFGVQNLLGAHCTGIEAVYRIRQLNGMSRKTCSVGAVGAVFELGKEMRPGSISH
jgi:7,8-dihydropterin-6-yl-methyl-4-(beta-D-ribofuranosyl)aminobenzene 5'-phosphate synthase